MTALSLFRRILCRVGLHKDRSWLHGTHRYVECSVCRRRDYFRLDGYSPLDRHWLTGYGVELGQYHKDHPPVPPKDGSVPKSVVTLADESGRYPLILPSNGSGILPPPGIVLDATDYTAMKRGVRVFILPTGEMVEIAGY